MEDIGFSKSFTGRALGDGVFYGEERTLFKGGLGGLSWIEQGEKV